MKSSVNYPEMKAQPSTRSSRSWIEWHTAALTIIIYGSWIGLTFFWHSIPYVILFLAGGWIIAWHGSLQHEVLHGHPTRSRRINDLIGWPPLSIWLPYRIYKSSHLKHHNDEWLTDPIEDPETYYLTGTDWSEMGPIGRLVFKVNNTLAGRLILGPFVALSVFGSCEISRIARGDRRHIRIWILHIISCLAVFAWTTLVCDMPIWVYLTAFVYSGLSLSRLRSFAEHRYSGTKEERTAIVENSPVFGLLFLHNNLHIVHHWWPQVAWYDIPKFYRTHRQAFISLNGGLVYDGYREVASRYLFRLHHEPIHPQHAESAQPDQHDVPLMSKDGQAITG